MPTPTRLSDDEIAARLRTLPDWSLVSGEIQRTYSFKDFVASMKFVNKVAEHAERARHHPDILIRYNRVTLTLSTHDANGLTTNDFDLAAAADGMA